MEVNISGLHCRLGVFSFCFIHNVTSGLKVQRNKVTTGSIGTVVKTSHKLQLYQFGLSRWVSEICGLSNRPAHAVRLKALLVLISQSKDSFELQPYCNSHSISDSRRFL